jgi:hypothetical protein
VVNAAALQSHIPQEIQFDWKAHVKKASAGGKRSIAAFFAASAGSSICASGAHWPEDREIFVKHYIGGVPMVMNLILNGAVVKSSTSI